LPEPVAMEGDETQRALAFADTYRMLNNRIGIFTSLPLTSLDKISLQRRLDEIGKTKTDVTREKA
jgi:arsenate reductase (thioredoxin)